MHLQERKSGLLVASDKPLPPPKPPEHSVRPVIREALMSLSQELSSFEQTTHGCMGPFTMEALAKSLVEAYERPSAYTISDLAQHIGGLVKEHA